MGERRSDLPIFQYQIWNAMELIGIGRNQYQRIGQGLAGKEKVVRPNRLLLGFQKGADAGCFFGCIVFEGDFGHRF